MWMNMKEKWGILVLNSLTTKWALGALMDFTLSNARWFYSSMGNPLARKGLINSVKSYAPVNPLTAEWALRALIDFTLSNARRFYSSMGNPLAGKGLNIVLLAPVVQRMDIALSFGKIPIHLISTTETYLVFQSIVPSIHWTTGPLSSNLHDFWTSLT